MGTQEFGKVGSVITGSLELGREGTGSGVGEAFWKAHTMYIIQQILADRLLGLVDPEVSELCGQTTGINTLEGDHQEGRGPWGRGLGN